MSVIIVCGVSLGACNTPVVAKALEGHRETVDGIFGFQPSIYGAGGQLQQISPVVKFAHVVRSDNPANFGLGAQHWTAKPKNTHLIETTNNDLHPGDGNIEIQDAFLAEMKQLIRPGDKAYCWGMYGQFGAAADPYNFANFLRRVAAEGIHVMHSPYRDYQTQTIVDEIMAVK